MAAKNSRNNTTVSSKKATENTEPKNKSNNPEHTKEKQISPKEIKESLGQYYKNVSVYIHYVNDLGLMFYPNESKNLSLQPEKEIKNSEDLKKSLKLNIIKQLTKSEYDKEEQSNYQIR